MSGIKHVMPQLVTKRVHTKMDAPLEYLEDSHGASPSMKRPPTSEPAAPSMGKHPTRQSHKRGTLKGG